MTPIDLKKALQEVFDPPRCFAIVFLNGAKRSEESERIRCFSRFASGISMTLKRSGAALFSHSMTSSFGENTVEGTWIPIKAELGGKVLPEASYKSIKLVISQENYTVTVGEVIDRGTIVYDIASYPKTMDIVGVRGSA